MSPALRIKGARLIDPANGTDSNGDVLVVDGKIVNSPSYAYSGTLIFGATARILTRFLETIGAPERNS